MPEIGWTTLLISGQPLCLRMNCRFGRTNRSFVIRTIPLERGNFRTSAVKNARIPLEFGNAGIRFCPQVVLMVSGGSTARGDRSSNAGGRHRGRVGSCRLRP